MGDYGTPDRLEHAKHAVFRQFDRAASSYDLLVGLNPGYHRHLRMSAERMALSAPEPRILDLCCGTGASTEAIRRVYPHATIVGLDRSSEMLARARSKETLQGIDFVEGDATDPGAYGVEGPFDGVLMAYGIRNVPDADLALQNLKELLVPGGVVVFHEYSVADSTLAQAVWDAVAYGVIIPSGLVAGGDAEIYRYLHASVRAFDGVKAFEARLRSAGFVSVWTGAMDGWQRGIVHSFVARRPA
ncbi:MAG: class I SAM-dependent methyltransferase [Sandaracinaceae bacterium]